MNGMYSLNGKWDLHWSDGSRGMPHHLHDPRYVSDKRFDAYVPGEIHLDLMRQGILDEVYVADNVFKARWVEMFLWAYRREFDLPAEASSAVRHFLRFDGLDGDARIYLNGTLVGTHQNTFRPCHVDITAHVIPKGNLVAVVLDSGLHSVSERAINCYRDANKNYDFPLHKRVWLRKPQSSFGWDWSPRLINIGIQREVLLLWDDGARVADSSIRATLSDDGNTGTAYVKLVTDACLPTDAVLETRILRGQETAAVSRDTCQIPAGEGELLASVTVTSPALWYPIGFGEQPLYTVAVRLMAGNDTLFETQKQTAFRMVTFNQNPHPNGGHYFVLEINGIQVFCKGANLVPGDMIQTNMDDARYDMLIARALESNMNFLRVWGGGVYESDYFYDECDRLGILVWQEFVFACATYPFTDPAFRDNVMAEAVFQTRRLARHPSLVAWCGNNEIDWGVHRLRGGAEYPDYALYHFALPKMLRAEDPDRYYQPSSPYSAFAPGESTDNSGDQHPWSVGIGKYDFWDYRAMCCRFPNEGGYLGLCGLATMHKFMPEGQRTLHSHAFGVHDNVFGDFLPAARPEEALTLWLNRDARKMPLEDYVYYAGFLQGEALTEYITNFRRRKFDCAAAVFWMYNDTWPCARSWTVVDYYANRTPAFYPVTRAFAPVIVVVALEEGFVSVYGVNDTPAVWQGEVTYGVCAVDGFVNSTRSMSTIPANASVVLARFRWDGNGAVGQFSFAWLTYDGERLSAHRLFTQRYFEYAFPAANITVGQSESAVTLQSDSFVPGVCLDLSGEAMLSDNFFDLYPGIPYRVKVPHGWNADGMRALVPLEIIKGNC